jgi:hypothetical protein
MFDGKAFGAELVTVVRDYVERNLSPVVTRIDAIERRVSEIRIPAPYNDAELKSDIATLRDSLDALPLPILPDIPAMIEDAVKAIPDAADIKAMVEEQVKAIPAPQNGADADPEVTAALVAETVERAVAALPRPMDGINGKTGEPGADGKDGMNGKDGADVVELLVDHEGSLIATLSAGRTKVLGPCRGKDGKDGRDADLTVPDEVCENVALAIRMMSETPSAEAIVHEARGAAPVHFHMPEIVMPEVKFPDTQFHVAAPQVNIAPAVIAVPEPKKRNMRTVVKKHDSKGRIAEFEQEEI